MFSTLIADITRDAAYNHELLIVSAYCQVEMEFFFESSLDDGDYLDEVKKVISSILFFTQAVNE